MKNELLKNLLAAAEVKQIEEGKIKEIDIEAQEIAEKIKDKIIHEIASEAKSKGSVSVSDKDEEKFDTALKDYIGAFLLASRGMGV